MRIAHVPDHTAPPHKSSGPIVAAGDIDGKEFEQACAGKGSALTSAASDPVYAAAWRSTDTSALSCYD